jgi:phosphoglycolate phosphatase
MRRLILFDIDGTLLMADGAGKRAVRDALMEVFGTTGPIGGYGFAGRTDPEIVRHLMREAGLDDAAIDAGLPRLWALYVEKLAREIRGAEVRALPGVPELLDRVEAEGGEVALGLLTGNVREGARIKVEAAGIAWERFLVGAFGSDHWHRPELPAVAARRARERLGVHYRGKEIVIVGDTPFDIACGEALGVRTVATATGGYGMDELAACAPDHLFPDLSDTEAVWEAIASSS